MHKIIYGIIIASLCIRSLGAACAVLVIGDSNGSYEHDGWNHYVDTLLGKDTIVYNHSRPGRTIAFPSAKYDAARTCLDTLVRHAEKECPAGFDRVIIWLGTNDAKTEYADRFDEIAPALYDIVKKLQTRTWKGGGTPAVTLVSPPPMSPPETTKNFAGGDDRVKAMLPLFKKIALDRQAQFVDLYTLLEGTMDVNGLPDDGIHLTNKAMLIAAQRIVEIVVDRVSPDPVFTIATTNQGYRWQVPQETDLFGYELYNANREFIGATFSPQCDLPLFPGAVFMSVRDWSANCSFMVCLDNPVGVRERGVSSVSSTHRYSRCVDAKSDGSPVFLLNGACGVLGADRAHLVPHLRRVAP